MNEIKPIRYLFTDGSVNPQTNIGFGAYLLIEQLEYNSSLNNNMKIKMFENTSSTKLELETLLWAFESENLEEYKVIVYTDCQNIIGLNDRRSRFETKAYKNGKNELIKNHQEYKCFYNFIDSIECEFIKVKGHNKKSAKTEIDDIFTLVDKATRKKLREFN